MSLTKATYAMIQGAVINVFDYMTQIQIDDIQSRAATIDVTVPLQAAITAAMVNGGTVYFPSGTYNTGTLIVSGTSGVKLVGAGMYETRLVNNRTDGNNFIALAGDNIELCDMEVDGSYATNPGGTGTAVACGNLPNTHKNIYVHDCLIRSNGFDAFGAAKVYQSKISDCLIYNYGDTGIDLTEGCTDWLVSNNTIISTGRYGIAAETFDVLTYGDSRRVSIVGNNIVVLPGVDVRYGIQLGTFTYGFTISGNVISLETDNVFGIRTYSDSCKRHTICGNSILGQGAHSGREGVHVEDAVSFGSTQISITGNAIESLEIGIRCYIVSDVTVSANVVNAGIALQYDTDGHSLSTTVTANDFNGDVKFLGYTATSTAHFVGNTGTFTFTNNTGWTIRYLGNRNTVSYNDGVINYIDYKSKSGATGARPSGAQQGDMYFDSTLGKPIWWSGSAWVDATGSTV